MDVEEDKCMEAGGKVGVKDGVEGAARGEGDVLGDTGVDFVGGCCGERT